MRKYSIAIIFFACNFLETNAQYAGEEKMKALSFNPFSIAEPHAALGLGFSNNFTKRSSYFAELSYVFKAPVYKSPDPLTGGYRLLMQYRYRVNRQYKAYYFVGTEFRIKHYGFNGNNKLFVNAATADTLKSYKYHATATSIGGGIVIGSIFSISKNKKWQLEITTGIGVKHKFIAYKNLSAGYKLLKPKFERRPDSFGPPEIDEAVGMPYIPGAVRLRYLIR